MATVELLTSEIIAPAAETPKRHLPLSNLDISVTFAFVPALFFYRRRPSAADSCFFAADAVKASLAKVLVLFYPLAGRLAAGDGGRPCIDCTGDGVLFVTARSDQTLDDALTSSAPSMESTRDAFLPPKPASPEPPCALVMLQMTYTKCGGVIIGSVIHHYAADGRGAGVFYDAWAAICRGGSPPPPFLDRTVIRPRDPPAVSVDLPEYKPYDVPADLVAPSSYSISLITLSTSQVQGLIDRCALSGDPRPTVFRAVVALAWQCACRARRLPPDVETRLFTRLDVRARLQPPLPDNFFGNAVVRTSVASTAGEIMSSPVGRVSSAVRGATNKGGEYARSVVDYVEVSGMTRLPKVKISRANLVATSWLGMSFNGVDFGWGAPALVARAEMYYPGYVYVTDAAGGGVSVLVALEPEAMPAFKEIFMEQTCVVE